MLRRSMLLLTTISLAVGQMGSPGGGETQAIALHPTDANVLYAGAAKGLCKTTSGGKDNWPSTGLETLSPRVIAINPQKPKILYAGTYEMGVYKTVDGGVSWSSASDGITEPRVRALVMHPHNPDTLYAGTDGGGVFRTSDGGDRWLPLNRGLLDKTVRGLLIDPDDPSRLYAATWHGVYVTSDGGANWIADPEGLYDVDVRALAFDPTDSAVLYAATHPRGVYRSMDRGKSWQPGREPLLEDVQTLAVDPHAPENVYAGTRAGVFRSRDRGDSWKPAGLHWSNRTWTLIFDARTNPATLYYGGEGGVLKTTNGGLFWDVTGPVRE